MSRRIVISVLASVALLFAPTQTSAAPIHEVVATYNTYLPGDVRLPELELVIHQGDSMLLSNLDPMGMFFFLPDHSITEMPPPPLTKPRFDSGTVPIGDTASVEGVEQLEPGVYRFFCDTHGPVMAGTLTVVAG
ncbi:MAG: hypothetical protein ACLGH3_03490 [Actinomycetota bacterium]